MKKKSKAASAKRIIKKYGADEVKTEFNPVKVKKGVVTAPSIPIPPSHRAEMDKLKKGALKAIKNDDVEAWVEADQEVRAQAPKDKRKKPATNIAVPVESERPGIARNPKPPKVHQPLAADGAIVPLEIISYHFLKLMERMAAEHGGSSAQALVDLKADIAKRKT